MNGKARVIIKVGVLNTAWGWEMNIVESSDHTQIPLDYVWNGVFFGSQAAQEFGQTIIKGAGVSNDGRKRYATRRHLRQAVKRYNRDNHGAYRIVGGLH